MMKLVITESQLSKLVEIAVEKVYDKEDIEFNKIFRRCEESKKKGIQRSPWCNLSFLYKTELDDSLKERLLSALDKFFSVYKRNFNDGVLPRIIELSLMDKTRTVNDLETIAEFLVDPEFSTDSVKRKLIKLGSGKEMPSSSDLKELLKNARFKEYTKYENSLDGEQFKPFKTKLILGHRCEEKMDEKFFELIKKVKLNRLDVDEFVDSFIKCISSSMETASTPIKADKNLTEDLFIVKKNEDGTEEKIKVLDRGYYEVKKFDPLIDSYLSEFFSIFKEGNIKEYKPEYLDLYNEIIERIFKWIKSNGNSYLEKVKSQIKGIIFKDNIIIPIKYVELYWSNKGQKGCDEKRISIRYKLSPQTNNSGKKEIEAYKYTLNSNIVQKQNEFDKSLEGISTKEIICE